MTATTRPTERQTHNQRPFRNRSPRGSRRSAGTASEHAAIPAPTAAAPPRSVWRSRHRSEQRMPDRQGRRRGARTSSAMTRLSTVIAKLKNWQQSCSASREANQARAGSLGRTTRARTLDLALAVRRVRELPASLEAAQVDSARGTHRSGNSREPSGLAIRAPLSRRTAGTGSLTHPGVVARALRTMLCERGGSLLSSACVSNRSTICGAPASLSATASGARTDRAATARPPTRWSGGDLVELQPSCLARAMKPGGQASDRRTGGNPPWCAPIRGADRFLVVAQCRPR